MNEFTLGMLACIFVLVFLLTGIELALAIGIVGFVGFAWLSGFDSAGSIIAQDIFDNFTNYGLTVFPLFLLMGYIANNAGIAQRLYGAAHKFVGRIPGGLAMATVVAATMFKAMCGSTLATAAAFSNFAVPEMMRYRYSRKLSTGIVASVGTIGILIPPSIAMIIYGVITEQSIGKLFLAGIIPGLLIAGLFIVIIYVWCKIDPLVGPRSTVEFTWKEKAQALPEFIVVLVIFVGIIGGIMKGFFTPTEAGSIGTMAALVMALSRKSLTLGVFVKSVDESLKTALMVYLLIACSAIFGRFLTITEIPQYTSDLLASLPVHRSLIMVGILFFYLLGGSFIEDTAFMILATPVLFPSLPKLGYDPIWFGVMVGVTIMVGTIIPPVAIGVFIVKQITGESFGTIYRGVLPFLASLVFVAILLFLFPQIATFLPSKIMGL
jgi:tripartite ATP-independent transporter DctM subunit